MYDHGHITMIIKTNKMMAMILNSIGVYATSEKSARYTVMHPDTELELTLYEKWTNIIEKLIVKQYPNIDEKQAHKLGMENARYMISVFTPTTMMYTVSFRQAFLICDYLEKLCKDCEMLTDNFSKKLGEYAYELADQLRNQIGIARLHDNKNQNFRFLEYQNFKKVTTSKKEVIADSYTVSYAGSLAMLAQAQRHRTIRYSMMFNGDYKLYGFYVPTIISNNNLESEWLNDMESVAYCFPQGIKVRITEQGIFEDFALKCKERLCGRAQLEVAKTTEMIMKIFLNNKDRLCEENKKLLESMTHDDTPNARCMFDDFNCAEGCIWGSNGALTRNI